MGIMMKNLGVKSEQKAGQSGSEIEVPDFISGTLPSADNAANPADHGYEADSSEKEGNAQSVRERKLANSLIKQCAIFRPHDYIPSPLAPHTPTLKERQESEGYTDKPPSVVETQVPNVLSYQAISDLENMETPDHFCVNHELQHGINPISGTTPKIKPLGCGCKDWSCEIM